MTGLNDGVHQTSGANCHNTKQSFYMVFGFLQEYTTLLAFLFKNQKHTLQT